MKTMRNKKTRSGVALLVVLIIVMVITVASLGFITRADRELVCGQNVGLRMQMDYLSQSALAHAKALILNPQSVDTTAVGYWQGGSGLQTVAGSDDYYDINIVRDSSDPTDHCDYTVTCTAYRISSGQKIAQSNLTAGFRIDPCIALRTGDSWASEPQVTVYGDTYCGGSLGGAAGLYGDGYSHVSVNPSNLQGQRYELEDGSDAPVDYPGLSIDDFDTSYYIESTMYSTRTIAPGEYNNFVSMPTAGNPSGVVYCNGDLILGENCEIYGTVVVKNRLILRGVNNRITAVKNFPALLVGDKIEMEQQGDLSVEGLVQVKNEVRVKSGVNNARLMITGALYIRDHDFTFDEGAAASALIIVIAAPEKAAIQVWSTSGEAEAFRWTPAAGGFFKNISRF